jgi:putative phosphonate catabolism associated alcohol dehydrogenase
MAETVTDAAAPLPPTARVAVYDAPQGPFRIASYPLRQPGPGEALARVRMSTICRSDIHSWRGHRPSPCPGLLGHEIIGTVVALGPGVERDMRDEPLMVGDRITWSEYFVPGRSHAREILDMPHKAPGVDKYGHMSSDTAPHHHGGFAEYCYIRPDSWILKLPDGLSDEEATPLNCGVATMCAVIEAADIRIGQTVAIVGLGLLGLYGAALAKTRGASRVIGIDGEPGRRTLSARFGVDLALAPDAAGQAARGVDVVIEACGDPAALPQAFDWLRTGGRLVVAGLVSPGAIVSLDANLLVRKCLSMVGVHNYHPRHLEQALAFVLAQRERFPFACLVDARYPLAEVERAMRDADARRVLRAAIVP